MMEILRWYGKTTKYHWMFLDCMENLPKSRSCIIPSAIFK